MKDSDLVFFVGELDNGDRIFVSGHSEQECVERLANRAMDVKRELVWYGEDLDHIDFEL